MSSITVSNTDVAVTVTDSGVTLTVAQGQPGVGVPAGGTTGQVLAKSSSADYATQWTTQIPLTDGDKGDVTVSGGGATWTIDAGAVNTTKLGGDITAAGKALLDDASAAAQRTTLGLGTIATQDASAVAITGGSATNLSINSGSFSALANEAVVRIVRKASAGTITKGTPVYVVGSTGTHLTVEAASNGIDATSDPTIGIAAESITNTTDGYMIVSGLLTGLSNLPTASFTDGAPLWLGTGGTWTTTRPTQPAHSVALGWVVSANNGSAGRAFIKVQNGYHLSDLHDVLVATPVEKNLLSYDGTANLWKNRTLTQAGFGTAATKDIPATGDATTTQVVYGTDTRLTNSRTPTGSAGGSLSGTYPNPSIATNAVTLGSIQQIIGPTLLGNGAIGAGNVSTVNLSGFFTIDIGNYLTFTDRSAASVFGRSAATAGAPADIASTADGQILRRSATTIGWGNVGSNTQVVFNDGGSLAGNSAFLFDKATGTLTVTKIVLANGEFFSNSTDGQVEIGPNGTTSGDYSFVVDGTGFAGGLKLFSKRRSDGDTNQAVLFASPLMMNNQVDFSFGSGKWYTASYQESTKACFTVGLLSGAQNTGSSGAMVICVNNERGDQYRVPQTAHTHPTLYVYAYRNTATFTTDYVRTWHDQTDGYFEAGRGTLRLKGASGVRIDSGSYGVNVAPTTVTTGYTAFTNPSTLRTCNTATVTLQQLAQLVGTLVEDLKTKGLISA